jgi:hypothetical protein
MKSLGVFVFGSVLLLAGIIGAQPETPPVPSEDAHGRMPNRQKMEALMVVRLTDELNLTEDQGATFFPRWKRLRSLRELRRTDRNAVLGEMSELLKGKTDDARLSTLVDSLETIDEYYHASEVRLRRELRETLTIEQQARYYVFTATFERQTRRMIQDMRREGEKPHR